MKKSGIKGELMSNRTLAKIIKEGLKGEKMGVRIVEEALEAQIPIAQIIRGVKKSFLLRWEVLVDDRRKKVALDDLVEYVKRAWRKDKIVRVRILFPYNEVPIERIMTAIELEAGLSED